MEPMTALTCEHSGPYDQIREAFERLFRTLATAGVVGRVVKTIGLYYDNPAFVSADQLRSRAGAVLRGGELPDLALDRTPIAAGDYAVLRYQGHYSGLTITYQWLFREWLPQSGRQLSDEPSFEEYLNMPGEVAESDLLTDIFVPLR